MGIAGSLVNHDFFERYLGMRVETVDMVEFVRRIDARSSTKPSSSAALAWVKANCKEGKDYNAPENQLSRGREGAGLGVVGQDGHDRPRPDGRQSATWPNWALAKRPWATTPSPPASRGSGSGPTTCPTATSWRPSSIRRFDWNGIREPFVFATENDSLNGVAMLFGHLLTDTAQVFADVRTYWSPEAVKRVTGYEADRARPRAA